MSTITTNAASATRWATRSRRAVSQTRTDTAMTPIPTSAWRPRTMPATTRAAPTFSSGLPRRFAPIPSRNWTARALNASRDRRTRSAAGAGEVGTADMGVPFTGRIATFRPILFRPANAVIRPVE
ncbi:hypothetical protein ACFQ9V_17390 [Leifsonia sp. NPDC056665]|uniref:hypothetical protein n=1 Tax=Leifsonia sp. NPDC056665 TaxID=3345901 RepID=UPI003684AE5E